MFDVGKNDVGVSSMSNLVNLVKAPLSLMLDSLKPKIGCSQIDEHVRVRMMFEKWCSSSFDKMAFDPSLINYLCINTRCIHSHRQIFELYHNHNKNSVEHLCIYIFNYLNFPLAQFCQHVYVLLSVTSVVVFDYS